MTEQSLLRMNEQEMRDAATKAVELIIQHFLKLQEEPVIRKGSRKELDALFDRDFPVQSKDIDTLLHDIRNKIFTNILHLDHPRCFAFVPGPSNFIAVIGDMLASAFNVFNGVWLESSGATEIELTVIDWLRQALGYPETAGGLFVSGGSAANLTALCAAREKMLGEDFTDGTAYFSDQTHSSVTKALRILGIRKSNIRVVPSNDSFAIDMEKLKDFIHLDREKGCKPFLVIGNAGTTNTGAMDPLEEIADVCRENTLWFHVDGAIGASTALCSSRKGALRGIDLADSITMDPHKWLFQPYEMGCLLVRDRLRLLETFHMRPEYLQDAKSSLDEPNLADFGMQLTRNFKALKLWLTFKFFGSETIDAAIERGFQLSEHAAHLIRGHEELQLMSGPSLGIVCFQYRQASSSPDDVDDLQQRIVNRLVEDGFAMVTTTVIRGRTVLRACTINPRTAESDIQQTLDRICRIGRDLVQ